ncbi:hypothetical protein [Allorhizocola rhizosphaerae]|uniref:hypothetical protein n=1 Tax=Allorhizocola rhizosphaerae TaxID=1872709 RepID=UPI001FE934C8|nr:hypothetical protein [Allorhizocola rhizosphaerae]
MKLDDLLDRIARGADARLAFQNQHPVAVSGRHARPDYPLLFLDVDGTLLPFTVAEPMSGDANALENTSPRPVGRRTPVRLGGRRDHRHRPDVGGGQALEHVRVPGAVWLVRRWLIGP